MHLGERAAITRRAAGTECIAECCDIAGIDDIGIFDHRDGIDMDRSQ